jgi:hypothetical protein
LQRMDGGLGSKTSVPAGTLKIADRLHQLLGVRIKRG